MLTTHTLRTCGRVGLVTVFAIGLSSSSCSSERSTLYRPATWTAPNGVVHQPATESGIGMARHGRDDECSSNRDCREHPGGVCTSTANPTGYQANICTYDVCSATRPCAEPGTICVPGGIWTRNAYCATAACSSNADCTAGAGGRCAPLPARRACHRYFGECPRQFACVYDDSPCSDTRACPSLTDEDGDEREQFCALGEDGAPDCHVVPHPPPRAQSNQEMPIKVRQ